MAQTNNEFQQLVKHPLKFRLFLLSRLPAAYFSGVRVREIDEAHATVSVPYKWLTQNPFRSTYFASLAMAAEMSTGVLALATVYKKKPAVSMLITGMKASFHKKATHNTLFTCNDGQALANAVEESIRTKAPKESTAYTAGYEGGVLVAEFWFTWSFKVRG
jgi:Domain of unknown function (DUF4442)